MSSASSGLPKSGQLATESKNGLMSSKDKKMLNKLVSQVADLFKSISDIPTDRLKRARTEIKDNNDNLCGLAELNGNVVTLNITATFDSKDLFILPKEYIPSNSLLYLIPIIKGGKVLNGQLHIFPDGSVTCTCTNYKGIIINTSVSYIK